MCVKTQSYITPAHVRTHQGAQVRARSEPGRWSRQRDGRARRQTVIFPHVQGSSSSVGETTHTRATNDLGRQPRSTARVRSWNTVTRTAVSHARRAVGLSPSNFAPHTGLRQSSLHAVMIINSVKRNIPVWGPGSDCVALAFAHCHAAVRMQSMAPQRRTRCGLISCNTSATSDRSLGCSATLQNTHIHV